MSDLLIMSASPWNRTNLFIARQYLLSRKRQSILAILGVVFGVAIFIVLLGFMTGVNDFLDDAVFKGNPDLIISPSQGHRSGITTLGQVRPLPDLKSIEGILNGEDNVQAYSRQVISPAILISGVQQLAGQLQGVDPDWEFQMVELERRLVSGAGFKSLETMNTILLGKNLARQLGVSVGDRLQLVLPNRKKIRIKVGGIFSFGISTIDNFRAYMHIARLEHLLSKEPLTTHIHVKLKDREDLSLKASIQNSLAQIRLTDWQEGNKTIVIGNRVRHVLTWTISIALLLVAGIGIFNIMNITVIQKRKDIAVMKTMGYRPRDITAIFSMQSLFVGLTGSLTGLLLGYLISLGIAATPLETDDFIIAETYPVNFRVLYYIIGFVFGLVTAVLSGYYPAKKASAIDPVAIIRGI